MELLVLSGRPRSMRNRKVVPGGIFSGNDCPGQVQRMLKPVEDAAYLKNSPMSGAEAAMPGNELTPKVESINRSVLSCWKNVVL